MWIPMEERDWILVPNTMTCEKIGFNNKYKYRITFFVWAFDHNMARGWEAPVNGKKLKIGVPVHEPG